MEISIIAGDVQNITPLLTSVNWSGDRKQASRKLDFTFIQDSRDSTIPVVRIDVGYTVAMQNDNRNLCFVGNIYQIERDRAKASLKVVAYDNIFVLNKSKTTRKFEEITPEAITKSICAEMGVLPGNIVTTGVAVSFIANSKSGYQIIQQAYTEAAKTTGKKYQAIMNADKLDVIEKGTLIGVELDAATNMTDSIYRESIEHLINRVLVVDENGNGIDFISDDDSARRYSMYQTTYSVNPEKDTATEARALLTKPEREGNVTALGDFRAISGYSIKIRDANFNGQFWIESDSHEFRGGIHTMKLKLAFENLQFDEVK